MSNTSAYGWNIPDNTDLVKDGALAIRTLGNAIDTSMNTALGTKKAGMVLLNTTSFSGVSSQVVTQFNANYENYRMIFKIDAHNTTNGNHNLRMRSGSTDDTGSNYFVGGNFMYANSGTMQSFSQNAATTFNVGSGTSAATRMYYVFDFIAPFLAQKTGLSASLWAENSTYSYGGYFNAAHNLATSYDGVNFYPSAGTLTGKVYTYGYNL